MADDVSDEEAAWRDLVARLAAPASAEGLAPWPVREELAAGPASVLSHPGESGTGESGTGESGTGESGTGESGTGEGSPDEGSPAGTDPDETDLTETDHAEPLRGSWAEIPGLIPAPPQARIIRPAAPAPLPSDDDGHFVPPPPPPLPRLDPVSKGAWAALFGGPGYLLLAVMLGWTVPGWAAFSAVAAFIGGFATLVVRMGDGPPRDSGPDNGAVV